MTNKKEYQRCQAIWGKDAILDIQEWHTPASDYRRGIYPQPRIGEDIKATNPALAPITIDQSTYKVGVYSLEWAVAGKSVFYVHQPIPITRLGIAEPGRKRPKTWMVDDPLHWYAAKHYLDALPGGRLLVAGLGLGLVLHWAVQRKDFTSITVVERNENVVRIIGEWLPKDDRRKIAIGDYYDFIVKASAVGIEYDSVYWDLAVGGPEETHNDFMMGRVMTAIAFPNAARVFHGLKFGENRLLDGLKPADMKMTKLAIDLLDNAGKPYGNNAVERGRRQGAKVIKT